MIHPNVRSTTQRRGRTLKVCRLSGRLTICRVRCSVLAAQVTSLPAYPPSAQIKVTVRKLAASCHSSGRAPSRSWTEAAVTTIARMRPITSTARYLFRPSIFFPASYPRLPLPTVPAALTDWESMIAAVGAGLLTQLIVHPPGGAAGLPVTDIAIDGAPVRQVSGQRAPHRPVVGQVADRVDDVAAAVAAGRAALAGHPARRGQQRLDDRPLRVAHVPGVPACPGAARPGRAAPAGHRGARPRRCVIARDKVQSHQGLLVWQGS